MGFSLFRSRRMTAAIPTAQTATLVQITTKKLAILGLRPARQGAQAEGLTEDSRGVERSEDPRKRGKNDYTLEGWQTTPAGRR